MVSIVHENTVPWLANQPADLMIDGETFSLIAVPSENGDVEHRSTSSRRL